MIQRFKLSWRYTRLCSVLNLISVIFLQLTLLMLQKKLTKINFKTVVSIDLWAWGSGSIKPKMAHKSGLTDKENQLLQRHWKSLKRDLRMSDIVDNLIEEGVLKPIDWEGLRKKFNTEIERTEEFLLMLTVREMLGLCLFSV